MELRTMFNSLFGENKNDDIAPQNTTAFKMLDSYENYFAPSSGYSLNDSTVRTCIDTIARNTAKMGITHVLKAGGKSIPLTDDLANLLNHRPNEYMSTYDFLYKVVSQLYAFNNAFIHIKTSKGVITGLYPISYQSLELREYNNELLIKFTFGDGQTKTLPYKDLIHIRRHFSGHEILGDISQQQGINNSLNILNSLKSAMENAVKNSTKLRGYLKLAQQLNEKHKENILSSFVSKFMGSNSKFAGVAVLDQTADYHQLNSEFKTMDGEQMTFCQAEIYKYFGLNESIIKSEYNAENWNSFYESVLEPMAIQLSQEFTDKLFTAKEKQDGHEILFTCDRLQYASLKDKVALIHELQPAGFISINEGRELFGFSPVEGGDERIISLNNVKASDMTLYQTGQQKEGEKKDE